MTNEDGQLDDEPFVRSKLAVVIPEEVNLVDADSLGRRLLLGFPYIRQFVRGKGFVFGPLIAVCANDIIHRRAFFDPAGDASPAPQFGIVRVGDNHQNLLPFSHVARSPCCVSQ